MSKELPFRQQTNVNKTNIHTVRMSEVNISKEPEDTYTQEAGSTAASITTKVIGHNGDNKWPQTDIAKEKKKYMA